MSTQFERTEIPSDTVPLLQQRLDAGGLVILHGRKGSGRSHAANLALKGQSPLCLRLNGRPWRHAEVLTQVALQLDDTELLNQQASKGPEAAIAYLDQLTQDRVILVDDADALLRVERAELDWTDAVPGMLAPLDRLWWEWLAKRRKPTLLVADHAPNDEGMPAVAHVHDPERWTVKLVPARGGYRDWKALVRRLYAHPGKLDIAAAVAPLLSADEFNALVNADNDAPLTPTLAVFFRQRAGSLVHAIDIVATLDGMPEAVVRDALALGLHRQESDPRAWVLAQGNLLASLIDLHLVHVTAGRVEVSAEAVSFGLARQLSPKRAARLAESLAARINNLRSLEPDAAASILAIHTLAVTGGREDLARSTAHLHVAGLVDLARTASLDERFSDSFTQYDLLRRWLDSPPLSETPSLRRVRSYVHHYRAWNGRRASPPLSLAAALNDSLEAVRLWPENARGQSQHIELLLRLGRHGDALCAVAAAEDAVAEHPQRARHLRARPAFVAFRLGLPQLALTLLDLSADEPDWADDPDAVASAKRLLAALRRGVAVSTLDAGGHTVVFRRPATLRLTYSPAAQHWRAMLSELHQTQTAASPEAAMRSLASSLRLEAVRLVQTPTARLTDAVADRKGLVLAWIDVLNSELGLDWRTERWLLGRIEEDMFVPVQRSDFAPIALAAGVHGGPGLWFGRVLVHRDGYPDGAVEELRVAGSGRSSRDLADALGELRHAE